MVLQWFRRASMFKHTSPDQSYVAVLKNASLNSICITHVPKNAKKVSISLFPPNKRMTIIPLLLAPVCKSYMENSK